MNEENLGMLRIKTFLAEGAIPLQGVNVLIESSEDDGKAIKYSRSTDRDGLTEEIRLPAPSKSLSLSPDPSSRPYSVYNVTASKNGYYTKRITGVPIFSGISSVLPINMIPESSDGESPVPEGNINLLIYQNPKL